MSDPKDQKPTPATLVSATPAALARGGLRLVQPEAPAVIIEPLPPVKRKRSNLASFFDAYADAIDRDVKALLDL